MSVALRRCLIIASIALVAACGEPEAPVLTTVSDDVEAGPIGNAAWSGFRPWVMRELREDGEPVGFELVELERLGLFATRGDGSTIRYDRAVDVGQGQVFFPSAELAPGRWDVGVEVDGETVELVEHEVVEHGRLPPERPVDVGRLQGALFRIEGLRLQTLHGLDDAVSDSYDPLLLELSVERDAVPGAEAEAAARLWAPATDGGFCRVWTGLARVRPDGRVLATLPEAIPSSGVEVSTYDALLQLGLDEGADEVEGVVVSAEVDTRAFDVAVDGDPNAPDGVAAAWLDGFGVHTHDCGGRVDGPYCTTAWAAGAVGERIDVADLGDALGADSLDALPPCEGLEEGESYLCSTVGSVAIGGWLAGLGVLLIRRRRGEQAPGADEVADPTRS